MLYTRKRKGLLIANIWFCVPSNFKEEKYLICHYYNMPKPILKTKGRWILRNKNEQTLVNDLKLSEENLLISFESNVRNEIRRADREGVVCILYDTDDLQEQPFLLDEFNRAYQQMYRQKELKVTSVIENLHALRKGGALSLSVAELEGKIVAYHVYVLGDSTARLLYSVSVFRELESKTMRSAIGRANRFLHYKDMIAFKLMKIDTYDWGGYSVNPLLSSINRFKAGFRGVQMPRYYATTTTNIFAAIIYNVNMKMRGK